MENEESPDRSNVHDIKRPKAPRLDWLELSKTIDAESAKGIEKHLRWCQKHLEELQEELRSDKR